MRGSCFGVLCGIAVALLLWSCDDPFEVKGGPGTLEFEQDTIALEKGDTLRLQPVVKDWQGEPVPDPVITWSSVNQGVVRVDQTGKLTATGPGQTLVWAKFQTLNKSVVVNVEHKPVSIAFEDEYDGLYADAWLPNQQVPVAVRVLGADGTGVRGVSLVFSVETGNGQIVSSTASDLDGLARAEWRLAARSGTQRVRAELPGTDLAAVELTLQADWPSSSLTVGNAHTCAVGPTGQVYCWGAGESGRLGTGSENNAALPLAIADGRSFHDVAAGNRHSCGIAGEQLLCWGRDTRGTVGGVGEGGFGVVPVAQFTEPALVVVFTSAEYNCGLTAAGHAYCWGDNEFAQLGRGTRGGHDPQPQRVAGDHVFVVLTLAAQHACGLTSEGRAYCWGNNDHGRTGTTGDWVADPWSLEPRAVIQPRRYVSIGAGLLHTCAVAVDGAGYCWGDNGSGQQGIGFPANTYQPPTPVAGNHFFRSIVAGSGHTCAIRRDGRVLCWGQQDIWGIGAGAFILSSIFPVVIHEAVTYRKLATRDVHTCGIADGGGIYCWGRGDSGQLGDGNAHYALAPVRAGVDAGSGN